MRSFASVLLGLVVCACGPGQPSSLQPSEPLRILFVGNSYTYTNDVPGMVHSMAVASSNPVEIESLTSGGFFVQSHLDQPDLIPLLDRGFDVVVLQGQHFEPIVDYEQFESAIVEIADRSHGARIVLYQTWPHRADAEDLVELGLTPEQMWAAVEHGYEQAAEASGAEIAPVGAAWVSALELEPSISMYGVDGFHPSAGGSFLAACVLYGKLFDAHTADWRMPGLPKQDAERLRMVADQTLAEADEP
jgi:hypothetical protein